MPLTCQFESYFFQSSFCFLFRQSGAFPRFLPKLLCFLDWSCSKRCRCRVTLVILLWSRQRIQWAFNLFLFWQLNKLYFERKYTCHQVLETRKATILNPTIQFHSRVQPRLLPARRLPCIFLVDVFEAFIFGNSLLALTLLALFGKLQKQLFIGVTLLVKRTSLKKTHTFWANFTLFGQVDDC